MKLLTLVMNLHLLHLNLTQHPAIYNIHTHKNPPTFCASSDLFGWL